MLGRSRIQAIAKKTTSRSGTEVQRQRNMVEGVQQAIKGMQALVSVEGLERVVLVGRQNKGFGKDSKYFNYQPQAP